MAKTVPKIDVLVLGGHPAAYLAAALLRNKSKHPILLCPLPDESIPDRLVMLNPSFFNLHPLLEPLRRKLDLRPVFGLKFLGDDVKISCEHHCKAAVAYVGSVKDIRQAMQRIAEAQGVEFAHPRHIQVQRVADGGVAVALGEHVVCPKALVVSGLLPPNQRRILGIPEEWDRGVVHRYSYVRLKPGRLIDLGNRPVVPMSLDLKGMLSWGWLLPSHRLIQIAVEQPVETIQQVPPLALLNHWASVLHAHGVLSAPVQIAPESLEHIDMPLGGALTQEGLANRTLLIGPAGGFYTACAEDIYPGCWSAIHAADTLKKALKEPHLQDALQPYRQRWRTTLGDYLRGPQQNLRFLLPLVYRNQVMTDRLAEAILMGKSVIR